MPLDVYIINAKNFRYFHKRASVKIKTWPSSQNYPWKLSFLSFSLRVCMWPHSAQINKLKQKRNSDK